jgi:SH3-like domain-containing protein
MRALRNSLLTAVVALALLPAAASAVDFKSVAAAPAIMFDAPGQKARKLFIAPAGMPVEIVLANGDWTRVRDASGELSWMESRQLSARRMLVVEAPTVTARVSASETATVSFTAAKGVLLELAEPIVSGWIKVKHRDGDTGFVKAADVWGE